jgi:hypothetical protein
MSHVPLINRLTADSEKKKERNRSAIITLDKETAADPLRHFRAYRLPSRVFRRESPPRGRDLVQRVQ